VLFGSLVMFILVFETNLPEDLTLLGWTFMIYYTVRGALKVNHLV